MRGVDEALKQARPDNPRKIKIHESMPDIKMQCMMIHCVKFDEILHEFASKEMLLS